MKHTFQCHSSTPNFKYRCEISGCTQTLKTYSAILSHLQRKHKDWAKMQSVEEPIEDASRSQLQEEQPGFDLDVTEEETTTFEESFDDVSPAQRSMAMLLLTLKERHRLTQSALDFCVGQIKGVVVDILDQVKASVKDLIGDTDIDECFDIDPFKGLDTEYLQTKFYREHFSYIVSYIYDVRHVHFLHYYRSQ